MKEIPLTQGKVAFVDDADYGALVQHRWCAIKNRNTFYAVRNGPWIKGSHTPIIMHRVILGAEKGEQVDHQDHNGLNNQRYNIRIATHAGNVHNRVKYKNNTTGFKGVHLDMRCTTNPYQALICIDGRLRHIGMYSTPEEAARAYDVAALELHGEFACLNFPGGDHD